MVGKCKNCKWYDPDEEIVVSWYSLMGVFHGACNYNPPAAERKHIEPSHKACSKFTPKET